MNSNLKNGFLMVENLGLHIRFVGNGFLDQWKLNVKF